MSTRSGAIYNRMNVKKNPIIESIHPISISENNRLSVSTADSDNDSTSTYDTEDEEMQIYTNNIFRTIRPKYEVNIDFDEASAAWRSNKRRVGESWVYVKPTPNVKTSASNERRSPRIKLREAAACST